MATFAPKRILCPVDLSPSASAVLSWARLIAQAFSSHVEVLHANWSDPPRYFTEGQLSAIDSENKDQLEVLRRDVGDLARNVLGNDVPFTVSVVEGHAVDVIFATLLRNPPDLVIMGSHGRSGVARLLLGSVAENVVREARCPVLIVRGPELSGDQRQLRRVLCPVKLTGVARQSAEVASALAGALGSELSLLRAVEDGAAPSASREELCQWVPQTVRAHCQVSETVVKGDAAEQIIRFARQEHVDLIVLGAEHRSFLEFSTLGRTTERVLRHGPTSVLMLPFR